jgi:hypothetical protein
MTMGEEEVGAARRAVVSNQNVRGLNAGAGKLILRHGDQIEARGGNMFRSVAGWVGAEKENRVPVSQ